VRRPGVPSTPLVTLSLLAVSLLVPGTAGANAPGATPPGRVGQATIATTDATQNALSWTDRARARRPRSVAAVLGQVEPGRPVTLVTVRSAAGRPTFTTTTVPDVRAAARLAAAALADPAVLGVGVARRVHVSDTTPAAISDTTPAAISDTTPAAMPWALTALQAAAVWADQSGAGSVVAVVDTGVAATHPDLSGLVLPGLDLVGRCGSGQADGHGHGTHVAGIIAARAGNAVGVAGLAQGTKILPVRALGNDGSGSDVDVASGIAWAAEHDADVINLSLGSPDRSDAEQAAIDYAYSRGVLVVAAAGNDGGAGDPPNYPGALDHVLAVGAVDPSSSAPVFSNRGRYVALAAPGVNVLSTVPPNGYLAMDGTSMAAPFVSATAALMRAANPALTPAQLTALLESTALDLWTPGRDDVTGYGQVRPVAAVAAAAAAVRTVAAAASAAGTRSSSGAVAPAVRTVVPSGTTLSLTGAPLRVAFHGTVTMRWHLTTTDGRTLGATPVTICRRSGDLDHSICGTGVTDATGTIKYGTRIATSTAYCATYGGTATQSAALSGVAVVGMLPYLAVTGGVHGLRLRLSPVVPAGETVTLQRLQGSVWVYARRIAVPSSESEVVRVSVPGRYRVVVPATALSTAAASAGVIVR
jgi:serine protease